MSPKTLLPDFAVAVSQMAVQAATTAYPTDYIVEHILKLSNYLIDLAGTCNLFGKPELDIYSPSLSTLFDRLQKKQVGPSLLPHGFLTAERIHARIYERVDEEATHRPLADYEDIYYALVARMQEMHQLLNLRIDSGFNVATGNISEGGPSIAELHNSLSEYWNILNNPSCGKALDDAIREARLESLRYELVHQVEKNNMTRKDAHEQLSQLYSSDVYNGILGLNFVQDWAPPMIGAYLESKYRRMLDLEKEEAVVKARLERRQDKMKTMREALAATSAEEKLIARRHARNNARRAAPVCDVDYEVSRPAKATPVGSENTTKSTGSEPNNNKIYHFTGKASMQHSPEHQAQIHPGHHYEEHTAAYYNQPIEDIIAHKEMHKVAQWQIKEQRVSEYSEYLRARASQGAQNRVEGSQSSVSGSPFGTPPPSWVRGPFHHPDMDYSQYEKF
ncbi:hypothetical protein BKA58DRAFT_87918 [Alternaria rosae]|uniref:uncharacterized protein n=1 Tax=Alternaria rosae TaxID=1187941 RepID=UPI001E8E32BE|nr:uncharacterized protein BKA58DRAFT_87918 [Alternaria rosae]KAH6878044.1 hypothetical protein BKA58DRAFT_87918 [Alternaria rosae]